MIAELSLAMFDPQVWAAVPFHFWSGVLFVYGSMVGSFLNVCIYRMPRGESIVRPPSHCPHCGYHIPWHLNIPLFTWLYLRGKCAQCRTPITIRYFLVELLTGSLFLCCWLAFGGQSAPLALVYCFILAGFIVATFIDFEHFIIPDEITLGGMAAGFICSIVVPALHHAKSAAPSMRECLLGMAMGVGLVYAILRVAKLAFGREKWNFPPDTRIVFGENGIQLPDREVPFEELFYRKNDTIRLQAKTVQMGDRTFENVALSLRPDMLVIGEERFNPASVTHLEAITDQITVPREAMGLGDVKFMGAIGAFLGWKAVLFSLMLSSMIGAAVGILLIVLRKKEWSSRLPYGPYIAMAAVVWMFFGDNLMRLWLDGF
jgi:leader peptidase (prepilin peptidase)/N-methyltransferase